MHRFKKPCLALLLAAVFCSGVYCGTHWSAWKAELPGETTQEPPSLSHGEKPGMLPSVPDTPETAVRFAPPETAPFTAAPAPALAAAKEEPAAGSSPVSEPAGALLVPEAAESAASPHVPTDQAAGAAPSPNPRSARADLTRAAAAMPFSSSRSSFSLHKMGGDTEPALLIVGGIQGDEPGGFSAAALIASHYTIRKGSVWVVPDLNFASILERGRGLFGDMNRKFAALDPKDPEYGIVMQIKKVLLDERVSLVLNLHDGSGFYRPTWEDALRNPKRWGQSVIIDQERIEAPRFNQLYETARTVEAEVNQALIDPVHRYHIHNTLTAQGNEEMAKTLSYFAVCNGKPAFGVEASKEFSTEYRAYYHLTVIEAFMRQMGIEFERDFDLTPKSVLAALNSNLKVAAYDNRWMLPLDDIRPTVNMLPFKKNAAPDIRASKPLLTLVPDKGQPTWRIAYGNRTLTKVNPEFMDFDDSLDSVEMLLDGKPYKVRMGDIVTVKDSFLVKSNPGFRVNAIGAQKDKNGSEADVAIAHKDFMPRYSLDKDGTTYRVELYRGKAFAGMVLVRFGESGPIANDAVPLTATSGPETELGF